MSGALAAIRRRSTPRTLIRETEGSRDSDGIFTSGESSNIDIRAVVQPVTGEDRELLPEGLKDASTYSVWTESEILPEDAMMIEGDRHVVVSRSIRRDGGFWRATFADQDGGK